MFLGFVVAYVWFLVYLILFLIVFWFVLFIYRLYTAPSLNWPCCLRLRKGSKNNFSIFLYLLLEIFHFEVYMLWLISLHASKLSISQPILLLLALSKILAQNFMCVPSFSLLWKSAYQYLVFGEIGIISPSSTYIFVWLLAQCNRRW